MPFAFTFRNLFIYGKKKSELEYSNEYEGHEQTETDQFLAKVTG